MKRDRETELAKILLDVIDPPRKNVVKRRRSGKGFEKTMLGEEKTNNL